MSTQETIHGAVLHGIGQTPRYEPFPAPVAGDGEAVVTVTAAALKPSDRWMANGLHYAPDRFPQVAGLDGVGRLPDGTRVAFFAPQRPYGGMAERSLVRRGRWFRVPDGIDDVTAAAVTNPGMAAWKTLLWGGRADHRRGPVRPGRRLPVGRAGRGGLRRAAPHPHPRRRRAPADPLHPGWHRGRRGGDPARHRPARRPIQLSGSGIGGPAALEDAEAAHDSLLHQVATGDISLDIDPTPLAKVEQTWPRAGSNRRIVFVP